MQSQIQEYLNQTGHFNHLIEVNDLMARYGLFPVLSHGRDLVYEGNNLQAFIGLRKCVVWLTSTVDNVNSLPLFHVEK